MQVSEWKERQLGQTSAATTSHMRGCPAWLRLTWHQAACQRFCVRVPAIPAQPGGASFIHWERLQAACRPSWWGSWWLEERSWLDASKDFSLSLISGVNVFISLRTPLCGVWPQETEVSPVFPAATSDRSGEIPFFLVFSCPFWQFADNHVWFLNL